MCKEKLQSFGSGLYYNTNDLADLRIGYFYCGGVQLQYICAVFSPIWLSCTSEEVVPIISDQWTKCKEKQRAFVL